MATRIKLKSSATPNATPTTSNLEDREVALNIADKKLYVNNGGSIVEVANANPNPASVTTSMLATDITNGPGNTFFVASTGSDSTTLTGGGDNGKHPDTPFLSLTKALSVATPGDLILMAAGQYQEAFPMTIPDGVHVRGSDLRTTVIIPTGGTNSNDCFILNGDVTVSDLTIKDMFYDSVNDTGYAFSCANNWSSERSAYLERITVLNKGSTTSASDPYGFDAGDAGRGAKLDGSLAASSSIEAAILFNECTFIVPNSVGLYLTNGIRVEWLNSFVYFANEGIKGVQGATGAFGTGRSRLKLSGVSGTFAAGEEIYQLEDQFRSGTYARSGSTVTVTNNNHGLAQNDRVYADFISGAATDGFFQVTAVTTNTFTFTHGSSGTTSGNITYKKADGYGSITSNDGTYIYLQGKGEGQFTQTVEGGKTAVPSFDVQVDNSVKKFGTGSLLLDGTGDRVNYATESDFGFGTANFCVEWWCYPTSVTGTQVLMDFRTGASDTAPTIYASGTELRFAEGGTDRITGGSLALNTWQHVAVARNAGTTRLFLDGAVVGTYTDSNDYGSTKPVVIGADYNSANNYAGHFDEIRVSKGTARFTGAFNASLLNEYGTDIFTVLLLHFNANDGATIFIDSGSAIKDIRSNGGDSATGIALVDYNQFGAELRSIGSANIYGNKGVVADGNGVRLLLTAHNFAYIGAGKDFTNDASLAVQSNETVESNGGRVFFSSTDQKGDFRVGGVFVVDQETGNVNFSSTSTSQEAASLTLSDATGTTNIFPAYIETGNLRLSGNTISTTSGDIIFDPAGNQDSVFNGEVVFDENIYFDTAKTGNFQSTIPGSIDVKIGPDQRRGGFNAYGIQSDTNILVSTDELATASIFAEGSGYTGGTATVNVDTNPAVVATATTTLDTANGGLKTVTVSNPGQNYETAPTLAFSAPQNSGTSADATANLESHGPIVRIAVDDGGADYGSAPTLTIDAPPDFTFNTETDVAGATITLANHPFRNDTQVVYNIPSGSTYTGLGLTDLQSYWVINVVRDDTNSGVSFQLASSQGGSPISLTASASGSGESHYIRGLTATATATVSAGAITAVSVSGGSYYDAAASPTINQSDTGQTTDATLTPYFGRPILSVSINSRGSGYTSAPSVTVTNAQTDTSGSGGAITSTIGYPIGTATVTNEGAGYNFVPTVKLLGGTPVTEGQLEAVLNKKTGSISSITVVGAGEAYSTAPTLTLTGGAGGDARLSVDVQSLAGSITNAGSGYTPGTYQGVDFTFVSGGTAPSSVANATFTVPGWVGTITNGGSGYQDGQYDGIAAYNVPAATYTVAVISNPGTPPPDNVYTINGNTQQALTLTEGNTYRFDQSDSSNSGHPLTVGREDGGTLSTDIVAIQVGTPGNAGAFTDIIVRPGTAGETADYICTQHANMGASLTIVSGSAGNYGDGLSLNVTVSGGVATAVLSNAQGQNYFAGDTVSALASDLGNTGSGLVFTLSAQDNTLSSVTDISLTGGPYTVGDVLSVDVQNVGGSGSGFQFTVNKVGFVTATSLVSGFGGFGYTVGQRLVPEVDPDTTGDKFLLDVATINSRDVYEISHDGSIISENFNVAGSKTPNLEPGSVTIGDGTPVITLDAEYGDATFGRDLTVERNATIKGNISLGDDATADTITIAAAETVTGDRQQTGNFTIEGDITQTVGDVAMTNATIGLADGAVATPSLHFANASGTGFFAPANDEISLSVNTSEKLAITSTLTKFGGDFQVLPSVGSTAPTLAVDTAAGTLQVSTAASGLQISTAGVISGVGTDADVNIQLTPKGQGDVIVNGAQNRKFRINDGVDVFSIDMDLGEVDLIGHLDTNNRLRIKDSEILNISGATLSFGQIVTVDTSGTATSFTDGSYTAVAVETTSGVGTGATFDVTVASGTITAITVTASSAGRDYKIGDTIVLSTATIGTDAAQTITITDVRGTGIDLTPQPRRNVRISGTGSFIVPVGTTNERPFTEDLYVGGIRYNTTTSQFEGYNGIDFVSLGGVRDVDQDTYILTEVTPGSDEDTFEFYNSGINSLSIDKDRFTLKSTKIMDVEGTLLLNGTFGQDTLDVQRKGVSLLKVRATKDVEVTGGLFLKNQLIAGEVATFDDGTLGASAGSFLATAAAYNPSQTFTATSTVSEFAGSGLTVDITTDASGNISSIAINAAGTVYEIDEKITVPGSLLGGGANTDVTFFVRTVNNADVAHSKISVLQSEFRLNMNQDKQFLSFDSTQAQAQFKVNRNYSVGGATNYLTVMDSTADFVELDDCRVEGGQLTTFTTGATFTQFEKNEYKGAKTLITIESDDGKVQMMEVTTVCGASGTVAHATITNSITSDNDLMDAVVNVASNSVQIQMTKSTDATSSTSFTGRFTTTKVKV